MYHLDGGVAMEKEDYILRIATDLILQITKEWDDVDGLREAAEACAKAANIIWDKSHPLQ